MVLGCFCLVKFQLARKLLNHSQKKITHLVLNLTVNVILLDAPLECYDSVILNGYLSGITVTLLTMDGQSWLTEIDYRRLFS